MTPHRTQLRRTKGWRKPPAIVVPRPTPRGANPHGGLHASAAAG